MAVGLIDYNKNTDSATFVCDSEADLVNLPTTTSSGKEELESMDRVSMGSAAIIIETSDVFMLGSDDNWNQL